MAANRLLLTMVRDSLVSVHTVFEKSMFGGVCFMVDDKLCVCVGNNYLLCRLDPDNYAAELALPGVSQMTSGDRIMRGYVRVDENVLNTVADVMAWVNRALAYNEFAKPSKPKK